MLFYNPCLTYLIFRSSLDLFIQSVFLLIRNQKILGRFLSAFQYGLQLFIFEFCFFCPSLASYYPRSLSHCSEGLGGTFLSPVVSLPAFSRPRICIWHVPWLSEQGRISLGCFNCSHLSLYYMFTPCIHLKLMGKNCWVGHTCSVAGPLRMLICLTSFD